MARIAGDDIAGPGADGGSALLAEIRQPREMITATVGRVRGGLKILREGGSETDRWANPRT